MLCFMSASLYGEGEASKSAKPKHEPPGSTSTIIRIYAWTQPYILSLWVQKWFQYGVLLCFHGLLLKRCLDLGLFISEAANVAPPLDSPRTIPWANTAGNSPLLTLDVGAGNSINK